MSAAMFSTYTDGSRYREFHPDPPSAEEARPFHVKVSGSSWIPISALVFARDEEHASARVVAALEALAKLPKLRHGHEREKQSVVILRAIASGNLAIEVTPYDTSRMSAKVIWSTNGGINS